MGLVTCTIEGGESAPALSAQPSLGHAERLVSPVLVADIGGATTRFGVVYGGGELRDVSTIVHDNSATLEEAIGRYLWEYQVRPHAAILAVAAPIIGDEIAIANRTWRFRLSALKTQFGFTMLRAVNDLEAVAYAVAARRDCEMRPLGAEMPAGSGALAVLGSGTGLGVAAVLPLEGAGWHVVPSEGGHISFGPMSPEEEVVFRRMRDRYGRISAAVLSGPGLALLYLAHAPAAQQIDSVEILRRATAGDEAARACLNMYVRLLGRFAGDVALMFKATGGVYISGGVASGLGDFLDASIFRMAFEAHPPYANLMAHIPSFLVTCSEAGLLGCAALAELWLREQQPI